MAKGHGPSAYREVLRRLKTEQAAPARLLEDAAAVADAGYGARALAAVAADPATDAGTREDAIRRLVERLGEETREVQVAESVVDILRRLPTGRDWMQARRRVLEHLLALPNGRALSGGIRDAAKTVTPDERDALWQRTIRGGDTARDDAKAVLRAAFQSKDDIAAASRWLQRVADVEDHDLRARSAAYLHHEVARIDPQHDVVEEAMARAAKALAAVGPDDADAAERWRSVVRAAATPEAVDALANALDDREDATFRADIHLALGAQADRIGDPDRARRSFDKSAALLPLVPPKDAERIRRKLDQATARLEGAAPVRTKQDRRPTQRVDIQLPTGPLQRHALALVNTYTGGTKPVHLRALARVAPLCVAFELDLILVGFPDDPRALLARAQTETRISGEDHLLALARSGRLRSLGADPAKEPDDWAIAGTWVATSERAEPGRTVRLEQAARSGAVALLVGLGPKGLPHGIRRRADAEYEITGRRIGLETATALGILADRLGRSPPPARRRR